MMHGPISALTISVIAIENPGHILLKNNAMRDEDRGGTLFLKHTLTNEGKSHHKSCALLI